MYITPSMANTVNTESKLLDISDSLSRQYWNSRIHRL
jgi:hypothetical protein